MAEELNFRHSGAAQRAKPGKRWAMPVNRINVEHCIPLEPAYPLIIAHIAGPEVDGVGRDRAWRSTLSSHELRRAGNLRKRSGDT